MKNQTALGAGLVTTALRWVTGWTYFSAFWRRLILENKLNPEEAGYIGEKFNHFLPNALGIKPLIEYLVTHPDSLWWSMVIFTVIEGIVGLLLMLGLLTRLMSFGVLGLALGILLGSGWLGTTCLDEWQIGVLGIAAGFTLFLSGGGTFSLDYFFAQKYKWITTTKWFRWFGSGKLVWKPRTSRRIVFTGSLAILGITLFTNQVFHGGVYGELHNLSVKPHITISDARLQNGHLSFQLFRDEGADVYGSFLIGISVKDQEGNTVMQLSPDELVRGKKFSIRNRYVAKVKPGKHSLLIPLGAKATITIHDLIPVKPGQQLTLELLDISGITWRKSLKTE